MSDRVALITGSTSGIGAATARRLTKDGYTVALHSRRSAEIGQKMAAELPGASYHQADLADEAATRALVASVLDRHGRLDVLVNNAGIQSETPGDDFDDDALERILAVNLLGAARCARAAIRHFLSRPGGGVIINTSSVHEIVPKPGFLAYSISKGGLGNLTRTLALEFADRGIRVNAVGPGATITDLNSAWTQDPEKRAVVESHIPMGRAATAEELAPVFAFLASDEASYVTGQTLYACGGLTLHADFARNWSS